MPYIADILQQSLGASGNFMYKYRQPYENRSLISSVFGSTGIANSCDLIVVALID